MCVGVGVGVGGGRGRRGMGICYCFSVVTVFFSLHCSSLHDVPSPLYFFPLYPSLHSADELKRGNERNEIPTVLYCEKWK